jgi:hypothetical protein
MVTAPGNGHTTNPPTHTHTNTRRTNTQSIHHHANPFHFPPPREEREKKIPAPFLFPRPVASALFRAFRPLLHASCSSVAASTAAAAAAVQEGEGRGDRSTGFRFAATGVRLLAFCCFFIMAWHGIAMGRGRGNGYWAIGQRAIGKFLPSEGDRGKGREVTSMRRNETKTETERNGTKSSPHTLTHTQRERRRGERIPSFLLLLSASE